MSWTEEDRMLADLDAYRALSEELRTQRDEARTQNEALRRELTRACQQHENLATKYERAIEYHNIEVEALRTKYETTQTAWKEHQANLVDDIQRRDAQIEDLSAGLEDLRTRFDRLWTKYDRLCTRIATESDAHSPLIEALTKIIDP